MPAENEDIFGDTQSELDLSDEGMKWEADTTFDNVRNGTQAEGEDSADEEPPATDDDAEAEQGQEVDDDAFASTDPAGDDDGEADPAGESEYEIPEAFKNKTTAELAKIVEDSQNHIRKQSDEIGELRKLREQVEQMQQQNAQVQDDDSLMTVEEFVTSPELGVKAYRDSIQLLESGDIGVDVVEEIISRVREMDAHTAANMDRDFTARMTRADVMQTVAPVVERSRQTELQAATIAVKQSEPDIGAYGAEVVRMVQSPATNQEAQIAYAYNNAQTREQYQQALVDGVYVARGIDPTKSLKYQEMMNSRKRNEASESGGSGDGVKMPVLSPEDQIRHELLNKKNDGGDLFAGFGS